MRRIDNWRPLAALAGIGLALGASGAFAQDSQSRLSGLKLSGDQPIQIESDKLEVRESENLAIFTGNVSVTQGPTVMKSGKMIVYYVKDGKGSAATGSANIDRLEVDNKVYVKSDKQVATGDRGTFDMKTEVLVLSGSEVVLSEGDNVLVGCKLTVQMKSGLAQVDGCNKGTKSNGRVMMSITPGSQKK
ncbi:LptA/OstA family protein [Aminobacter sp. Piv2-1]|uniref:LptA/OstA family protein n=1 Tax=Aminobacter sp. Piv2-1 TaxID=3031122 RepID=UPI0030A1EEB9